MTKEHPARETIINLHQCGHKQKEIVNILKNFRPKVTASLVSKTIGRFEELGTAANRPGRGRKKEINEELATLKIQDVLRRKKRHPRVTVRMLAGRLGVGKSSVQRLIKGSPHISIFIIFSKVI